MNETSKVNEISDADLDGVVGGVKAPSKMPVQSQTSTLSISDQFELGGIGATLMTLGKSKNLSDSDRSDMATFGKSLADEGLTKNNESERDIFHTLGSVLISASSDMRGTSDQANQAKLVQIGQALEGLNNHRLGSVNQSDVDALYKNIQNIASSQNTSTNIPANAQPSAAHGWDMPTQSQVKT